MRLVLIRHGESLWNVEQRFTGWTDIDLTEKGYEEARAAGRRLRGEGFQFDVVYTSMLKRSIRTAWTILDEMDALWVPVRSTWRLNERCFGALEGMKFAEAIGLHGDEWWDAWKQDYSTEPPPLAGDDPRHPRFDARYAAVEHLPSGESMIQAMARIEPVLREVLTFGRPLVVSHGNTIRALDELLREGKGARLAEVPTATPFVYEVR